VAATPFGSTVPLIVAPLVVTPAAGPVVTVGRATVVVDTRAITVPYP
jgi:hypothetical protein